MLTRFSISRLRLYPFAKTTPATNPRLYMARKFDFDYNFDPEGTSLVKPDPYTDNPLSDDEGRRLAGNGTLSGSVYDYLHRHVPMSSETRNRPRSRSQSPPPLPPPVQLQPSPEYLSISQQSSSKLNDAHLQRKLLILDLNGTLVFRSPHQKRGAYQLQGANRPLRSVHRRPYLMTFMNYLFHPDVRTWLDTMVWSSAQPHSVTDMVHTCFDRRADDLVAIWARDTLGLSAEEYNRKTQTTKDLEKPWAQLRHSARTTLLLDDSPLKAHLQPWNHLCIKEYVSEMRKNDAKVREAELVREIQDGGLHESHGKRKDSNGKKAKKLAERIARAESGALGSDGLPLEYDQTLLAVVGILDAIKGEDNVAAWMKSGGLTHILSDINRSRYETPGPPKKRRYSNEPRDSESSSLRPSSPAEPPPSSSFDPHWAPQAGKDLQEDTGIPLVDSQSPSTPSLGLWFDHPDAFQHWAEQGRLALDALGIEIYHGITT